MWNPALDLRAILVLQPNNMDAIIELEALRPRPPDDSYSATHPFASSTHAALSSPASCSHGRSLSPASPKSRLRGITIPKLNDKPLPFAVEEEDKVGLKIRFSPLTIQIDPYFGSESFSYPSWDRYEVLKA